MKPRFLKNPLASHWRLATAIAAPLIALASHASAATFTWDGGGVDANWSTPANWVDDVAPAATGDNLVFDGATNVNVNNDFVTSLGSTSFTFAEGAGSFNIGGNALTVGNPGGNDNFVTKISTNDQTISANLNFAAGGRDRTIVMTGGGTLTLSGNVNFANDWLFPTTAAGTIVLSGNNSGDGKGGVLNAGTNSSRAMMRNNVANTQLTLGSDTALGNSGSGDIAAGTANFRGLVANQNLNIGTTGGDRNLAGSSIIINSAKVTFNGADNLTLGNLINQGGNRDFLITDSGSLTVQNSLSLSHDQTSRQLYLNLQGAGGMTINGPIHNTFHSGGITNQGVSDALSTPVNGLLRKAGPGTLHLNGDSGTTFTGELQIEGGTVVLGSPNALGAATYDHFVPAAVQNGFTFQGSAEVVLEDATGVEVGMLVNGTGIPAGTTVTGIDGVVVTLSQAATLDASPVSLTFGTVITKDAGTLVGRTPNYGTLDLNGQTIGEPIFFIEGAGYNPGSGGIGALINTNTGTPAAITRDITGVFNFTIGGDGDITVPRLIASAPKTVTKIGNGTFTTNGTSHNNLCGWVIDSGTVVFANTSGLGSDRGTTLNGGTLKIQGANSNLINDGEFFTVNGGTFDLNGKSEAVASIGGTGGTITNNSASLATLYVGGGSGGSSSASFAGAIQDGAGVLNLVKEGTGTQTLTGTLAYSGNTIVTNGTLELQSASLDDAAAVDIKITTGPGVLHLNHTGTDIVGDFLIDGVSQGPGLYGSSTHPGFITGEGMLQVGGAPADPYTTWANANGASGQTIAQDHDNDGVDNGVEYFMGETGSTMTVNPGPVNGTITWPMSAGYSGVYGTDFEVQSSTDLVIWTQVPEGTGDNTVTVTAGTSVVYDLPTGGKIFVRLVVRN